MIPWRFPSDRRNIDPHVLPELGQRQLAKLSPGDLDLFYAGSSVNRL